ncbi:MAG: hypothetical protein HY548_08000 [Elusimicrobia bacterium]|nr:hypothetical protein [Elusimicrobiota bacterium]
MRKRMSVVSPVVLLLMGVFVGGCGPKSAYLEKGEVKQTIEQESFRKEYVESIGIGAADSALTNVTQRRALSRDAAIVKAQYEMLSMIKGLQLTGGITVDRAIETDSTLQTKIDAEIKAAEIIKSEWTNDDGCVVTLRLNKKRLNEMMSGRLLQP